jgi:hypothetical protein
LFQRHVLDRRAPGGAGIVDQDVEVPELLNCFRDHVVDLARVPDVAGNSQRLDSQLSQLLRRLLAPLFFSSA